MYGVSASNSAAQLSTRAKMGVISSRQAQRAHLELHRGP